ncbi:MAG: hypothetical protein WAL51_04070 [Candidatus Acidiferrales bacterium]
MDVFFSWRKTRASDLPECLKLHPVKNGAEIVGPRRALQAWKRIFEIAHASRSALVELHGKSKVEIVGFGLAAFVKKRFAEAELLHPAPGLNSRIIESVVGEKSVIASYEEVRDANSRGDLQQVILDTSWNSGMLDAAQVDEVRILLGQAYQELFAGYNFSRILWECVDELDLWHIHGHRSFRIVDRFEAYRLANPETTWNADRALAVVTVEGMREDPHSIAAGLFHYRHQPQLAFTRNEQELLEAALEGLDDASASKSLFVTVPAIKRRWANIFERVAAVLPDLCPPAEGGRGIQKRQRVLTYVRNHPQELRPFNFGNRHKKSKRTAARIP